MPLRRTHPHLIRIITAEEGHISFATELVIRFGYGETVPWVTRNENAGLRAVAGPDMLLLRSSVALRGKNLKSFGEFALSAGESASFVLTYSPSHLPDPPAVDASKLMEETDQFGGSGRPPAISRVRGQSP